MTEQADTCALCGRLVTPHQKQCACGAIYRETRGGNGLWWNTADFAAAAPWVAAAGLLLLLIWLIAPPLSLHYSLMPLLKLYLVVVILSSILCVLAADRLQKEGAAPGESALTGLTPVAWFALLLVAWPVAFPAFLRVYYEGSLPQRVKTGYITTGLFLFALLIVPLVVRRQPPEWTAQSSTAPERTPPAAVTPAASPAVLSSAQPAELMPPVAPSPGPAGVVPPVQSPASVAQPLAPLQPTPTAPQPVQATPQSGAPPQSNPGGGPTFGLSILPRKGN